MKREAITNKDLIEELRSRQRKIKLLGKASLTAINKNQTTTKQCDVEYNSILSDVIAGFIDTPEGKLITNMVIINNVAIHFEKALRKIETRYYQIFKNSISTIFPTDSANNRIGKKKFADILSSNSRKFLWIVLSFLKQPALQENLGWKSSGKITLSWKSGKTILKGSESLKLTGNLK